ncbi:MAG: 1,2-dihydroxy-3-keto-5-methylthiopentene dioxygenase [Marteilia pararefringens]
MATLPNMDANSQFFLQADMQDALVVMQPSANAIDIYDIETFKPINEYVFEHKSSKMQCSDMLPTTGLFACAYDNFEIAFFDTRSSSPASDSSPIAPFLAHSTTINCLRLLDSPSLCLLTSSTDGILRLWDLRMAREAKIKSRDQTLCCFDSLVHSHKNDFCMSALEFVPNSPPTVCTAGYDGCVNIFSFD